jgi:hypothetical protein
MGFHGGPRTMNRRRTVQALSLLTLLLAGQAGGQMTATIAGRVTDKATGRALRAEIALVNTTRSVFSDSSGRYEFSGLPSGTLMFQARSLGFTARTFTLQLSPGHQLAHSISMDSIAAAQRLPAVGVAANAPTTNYRLTAFERRKQTGRGFYLTEDEIIKSGASSIAEAVRHFRGVIYECGGGRGCFVRMARAPGRCLPEYVVDDQVMNDFGPHTPIRDIIALELYSGPADAPGEYAGRNAGCGLVVVWTRSGPDPRRRR